MALGVLRGSDSSLCGFDLRRHGSLAASIEGSGPKAWIWSRFSSARSMVVVSTMTRPVASTSLAILKPISGGWPNSFCSMWMTYW